MCGTSKAGGGYLCARGSTGYAYMGIQCVKTTHLKMETQFSLSFKFNLEAFFLSINNPNDITQRVSGQESYF